MGYLASWQDGEDPNGFLFSVRFGRKLDKDDLRHMQLNPGKKANVTKCYLHRFRHAFASTCLRSGGVVFALQALLGRGTLEMVQHDARIAEVDVAQPHHRASPADNYHL